MLLQRRIRTVPGGRAVLCAVSSAILQNTSLTELCCLRRRQCAQPDAGLMLDSVYYLPVQGPWDQFVRVLSSGASYGRWHTPRRPRLAVRNVPRGHIRATATLDRVHPSATMKSARRACLLRCNGV